MTAPTRPPLYVNAIAGEDSMPPEEGVPWLLGNLVSATSSFPHWTIDDLAIPVTLRAGDSSIGFEAAGLVGVIEFAHDPSGWLLVLARVGDQEVFRGYVECVYEEYEVWPSDSGAAEGEAPGRIGKKAAWVSLSAGAWPKLLPLAPQGWFNAEVDDARPVGGSRN